MTTAKDRVREEQVELREKIEKLGTFLGTEAYAKLSSTMRGLLDAQLSTMNAYHEILSLRLAVWES